MRYDGSVQMGTGATTHARIDDLDSSAWRIAFLPGSWVPATNGTRRQLLLRLELLEGGRSGESSWGDLVVNDTDHGAQMTGRMAFSLDAAGPGFR
jgi:hypothetical protein